MPSEIARENSVVPGSSTESRSQGGDRRVWRRRTWIAAGALLALVVAATAARYGRAPAATAPAARDKSLPVPVGVAAAIRQDVPVRLDALGSVVAFNTVTVRPRIDGQLVRVPFSEGQMAARSQVLAEIDPRPFQVVLEQAEGQLARDEAQLAQARTELARYQLLLTQDSIARTNVDTQAATVKQLEGALQVDQAAIHAAKLNLSFTQVTSPLAGQLGLRQVDAGNLVTASTAIVVVTQIQPIGVVFALPEDALRVVLPRIRAHASLPVEVFDRSGATRLASGSLLAVDNEVDPTTGTVRLKATFDNRDRALFPAQFVNVQIVADVRRNQVVVPAAAVQQGPKGSFVYAVENGTAVVRPITVDSVTADVAAISHGIDSGTPVVIDGADRLRNGSRVTVRRPGDTPGAARPTGGANADRQPS
jgi:multidrug efflux system membrane fusion protein